MYLKTKPISYLAAVFFVAVFISSCDVSFIADKDIVLDDLEWDGDVKIPLGFIDYNVAEIFTDLGADDFTEMSTEEFSFSYTESFSSQDNEAFNVPIEDESIQDEITVTDALGNELQNSGVSLPYTITPELIPGRPNPIIGTFSSSEQTIRDLELSQELTGASLSGGVLEIALNSNSDSQKSVVIEIPSFINKNDQSVFLETIVLNGNEQKSIQVDLADYNTDFTNDGTETGKTVNTLVANVETSFTFKAGDVITANDNVSYSIDLRNLAYEVIFGDFKKETFNVADNSIDLGDFFNNFNEADVDFDNIQMTINVTNDFGFPIGLDLSSIKGVGSNSSTSLTYTGGALLDTLIINEVENFGDDAKVTNVILDKDNSNLEQLLKEKPTSLQFDLSGSANPLNSATANSNFYASDNTGLTAEIEVAFEKLSLTKTVDFDGEALEDVASASIIVSVENKIPLGGEVTLDFKNASGLVVHTEVIDVFTAASVNAQGVSDGVAKSSNFTIDLSNDEIASIANSESIAVKIVLVLPSGENSVTLKGTDELKVKMGLEANATITSTNN